MKSLSDEILLKETLEWSAKERAALTEVLWRLREIEERKLFSDLKCGSLFVYCVRVLKYSEGQANRRVSASRMFKQMPEIADDISSGQINLTQINQVKGFFDDENIKMPDEKRKVLELVKGKTTRETEKILDSLKSINTPKKLEITLLEEVWEELKKLRALKAHSCPDMDSFFRRVCKDLGPLWDPMNVKRKRSLTTDETRYVQVSIRAEVWERDKGQCQICASSIALELDHIRPFAKDGKTTVENLRLLCRNCNQRQGIKHFGSPPLRRRR